MTKFDFEGKIQRFKDELVDMNEKLAEATKEYFLKSFDDAEWDGDKWPTGGKDYHDLNNTGELRQALEESIQEVNNDGFKIEVISDYGIYQNEGTDKIPKRQFVGDTRDLKDIQKNIIKENIKKTFE